MSRFRSTQARCPIGDQRLLMGMPADVFVKTGVQSPLAYLTRPLRDGMMRAWREP